MPHLRRILVTWMNYDPNAPLTSRIVRTNTLIYVANALQASPKHAGV
jgi:hypothetical protein